MTTIRQMSFEQWKSANPEVADDLQAQYDSGTLSLELYGKIDWLDIALRNIYDALAAKESYLVRHMYKCNIDKAVLP